MRRSSSEFLPGRPLSPPSLGIAGEFPTKKKGMTKDLEVDTVP